MGKDTEKPAAPRDFGGLLQRVWRSIVTRPVTIESDADRRRTILEFLVLHMRPVRVRSSTLKYTHTFGLGGMSLVLIAVLMATGLLLMLAYEPSTVLAYQSIEDLQNDLVFGSLIRNLHHWSANVLVAIAALHLLRVLLTGGFHGPRRFNWVIGLGLLLGICAANFTGYLLPWDQLSYWAVTICTGMLGTIPWFGEALQRVARGGEEIGQGTLVLYYSFHTTIVPVSLVILTAFHFWRVRKARGVVSPMGSDSGGNNEMVTTMPHLLLRELAVGLTLVAVLMVFSTFVNAPLDAPANPGMSPNPAKAPWYFLGFQELQIHFAPLLSVLIIPLAAIGALVLLPYLRYEPELSGPWFLSTTGRRTSVIAISIGLALTPLLILADDLLGAGAGDAGWLTLALLCGAFAAFAVVLVKKLHASKAEAVQAMVLLLMTAFVVLTATGIWFRGPGMALTLPWGS